MNLFDMLYEMWYFDILGGDGYSSMYMFNEVAIFLTYLTIAFFLYLCFRLIKMILSFFKVRGFKR